MLLFLVVAHRRGASHLPKQADVLSKRFEELANRHAALEKRKRRRFALETGQRNASHVKNM